MRDEKGIWPMQFYVEKVQSWKMCVLSGVSFFAVNISAINRDFYV